MVQPDDDAGMLRRLGQSEQAAGIQRIAVFAMVPLLGILGFFLNDLLSTERKAVESLLTHQQVQDEAIGGLSSRVTAIESSRNERSKAIDQFQSAILSSQESVQGTVNALSNQLAALTARMDFLIGQKKP